MKHTPETPLPWYVELDPETDEPSLYDDKAAIHHDSNRLADGIEPKDAAYTAHAANAYPRLIEALRKVAIGKPYAERSADLLRELGEL